MAIMRTREDVKRALSDYSVLLINRFIIIGIYLLSAVLIARFFGKQGYGQLSLFLLVVNIAFLGFIGWTSTAVLRFGKEEFIKGKSLANVFWARNVFIFAGISISLLLIFIFRKKIDGYIQCPFSFIFVAICLLSQTMLDYSEYLFQAAGRLKASSFIDVTYKLFFLVLLLFVFLLKRPNIIYVYSAFALSQFFAFAASWKRFDINWFLPARFAKNTFAEIWLFSYPLIFSSIAAQVINYIDLIVVKAYFPMSVVGAYSLSYNLMTYIMYIIMTTITVTTPLLIGLYTEGREDLIKSYVSRLVPQGVFFWSIFLTCNILFAHFYIPMIFGKPFILSILPTRILLVGLALNAIASFYSGVLNTYKLIKQIVLANIGMSILNLIGDIFLVPAIGINGAAVSSALTFSTGGLWYMYLGNKRLKLKEIKSVFFFIPVITALVGIIYKVNLFLLSIAIAVIYYTLLKRLRLFSISDTRLLDQIGMPLIVRKNLHRLYKLLDIGRVAYVR